MVVPPLPSPPLPSSTQELEQHERLYQLKLDDLLQQHQLERRRYPRQLKVEHKNHMAELKRANRGQTDTTTLRQVRLLPWQCCIMVPVYWIAWQPAWSLGLAGRRWVLSDVPGQSGGDDGTPGEGGGSAAPGGQGRHPGAGGHSGKCWPVHGGGSGLTMVDPPTP